MRIFDDYGLKMCAFQGNLFEKSLTAVNCSSPVFLRRFMYSKAAERMDKPGFLYEACGIGDVFREIEDEFGESSYGQIRYGQEELYWMGYLYRYWSYTKERSSKAIYRMVKPGELRKLYYPYHSLDPAQAVERIMEAKGLTEPDDIQRGVEILRRIRMQNKVAERGMKYGK